MIGAVWVGVPQLTRGRRRRRIWRCGKRHVRICGRRSNYCISVQYLDALNPTYFFLGGHFFRYLASSNYQIINARQQDSDLLDVLKTGWGQVEAIGASASDCPICPVGGSAGAWTKSYVLPNLHAFPFPLTATTDLSISIHYVSASIYIYIYALFQFPDHLLRCSESVREKDKEGPSRSSARSTGTSLQIPR